jgi:hypothetical protein
MDKFLDDLQTCLVESGNISTKFLKPLQGECKEACPSAVPYDVGQI